MFIKEISSYPMVMVCVGPVPTTEEYMVMQPTILPV